MSESWREAAERLGRWMEARDYCGYDPFDAALSPLARPLAASRWASVGWIQLHRRLPCQLRPLVGVRPHVNPKTLALALVGWQRLEPHDPGRLTELSGRLLELQQAEGGWGYPFPWANRHFQVPAGTPASVPTAFAVHALLDTGVEGAVPASARAASFIAEALNRVPTATGVLLSYTPLDERGVHNASLLSASVLARVGRLEGDERLLDLAREVADTTVRSQSGEGGWPYGISRRDRWEDSFHTGYILTALRRLRTDLDDPGLEDVLQRGFHHWRRTFLTGPAVASRPGRVYPVDAHAVAQAILTLREFDGTWESAHTEADRLGRWALSHLRRKDGAFRWWKGKLVSNPVIYMRWVQAWMFRGLSELVEWERSDGK